MTKEVKVKKTGMSCYELVFIARPELNDPQVEKITEKCKEIIQKNAGKIVKKENWGLRNFAYKIGQSKKGHYVMLAFESNTAAPNELSASLRITEDVLRHLVVSVESISTDPSPMLTPDVKVEKLESTEVKVAKE